MKTCTNGDNCAHKDGPELPETEFYDYSATGGRVFTQCKACCRVKAGQYKKVEEANDVADLVSFLKTRRSRDRTSVLHRWIKDGKLGVGDFHKILKSMV